MERWKFTNKWKWLFIGLLLLNSIVIVIIFFFIMMPSNSIKETIRDNQLQNSVDLTISTNKADVTKLINNYIEKESLNKPLHYRVEITDKVMLIGTITAFSKEIDLILTFTPEAQKNGDILLKHESISLGSLQLPVSYVLKYVSENYALPEWVQINSKEKTIYASLTKMKLKSDVSVKVEKFDLEHDDIRFSLSIPIEK